jgi:hypothetical protein
VGDNVMSDFEKKYGIFKYKDGKLLGYVEHSFEMSWQPDLVRQWNYEDALYNWNRCRKRNKQAFIAKISGGTLPSVLKRTGKYYKIDWKTRQNNMIEDVKKYGYPRKFNRRNVAFKEVSDESI